ncbi:hypothetical protein B484DRAFT_88358 [Ochromonadaceae sp. CCMP2298]|nr:hypothetical protein B484DRAFT_88358 [Ochromonadaceae sp. CCMP2298]
MSSRLRGRSAGGNTGRHAGGILSWLRGRTAGGKLRSSAIGGLGSRSAAGL